MQALDLFTSDGIIATITCAHGSGTIEVAAMDDSIPSYCAGYGDGEPWQEPLATHLARIFGINDDEARQLVGNGEVVFGAAMHGEDDSLEALGKHFQMMLEGVTYEVAPI